MSYLPRDLRHITTCDSTRLLQAQDLKSLHSVKLFYAQSLLLVLRSFDRKASSCDLSIHFALSESYENKLHLVFRRQRAKTLKHSEKADLVHYRTGTDNKL